MSRKRLFLVAPFVLAALIVAGVALAGGFQTQAQAVSASFSAATVQHAKLTTCTVNGGDTFATTLATYTGTSTSSDPRLNGTFTIRAESLVDTTSGLGRVAGVFHIRGANGVGSNGSLNAAVAGGTANGSVIANVRGPGGRFFATLTSPFDPATGFGATAPGSIGAGSIQGTGVLVSGLSCHQWHKYPLRWLHRHMHHHG
jgi:hypothetical protein